MITIARHREAKTPRPLSSRQMLMAGYIAKGMTAVAAYEKAGYKGDAKKNAVHVTEKDGFQHYYQNLLERAETEAVATRVERLELLSKIMRDNQHDNPRVSLSAADLLNRMTGEYAPERFRAEVTLTPVEEVMKNLRLYDDIEAPEDS